MSWLVSNTSSNKIFVRKKFFKICWACINLMARKFMRNNDHTSSSFNSISLPIVDPFPSKLDNVQEEPFFMCINEHFEKCKKMQGLDVKICIIKSFRQCIYINRNDILRLYKMGVLRYDYCLEKHWTITGRASCLLEWYEKSIKRHWDVIFTQDTRASTKFFIC